MHIFNTNINQQILIFKYEIFQLSIIITIIIIIIVVVVVVIEGSCDIEYWSNDAENSAKKS